MSSSGSSSAATNLNFDISRHLGGGTGSGKGGNIQTTLPLTIPSSLRPSSSNSRLSSSHTIPPVQHTRSSLTPAHPIFASGGAASSSDISRLPSNSPLHLNFNGGPPLLASGRYGGPGGFGGCFGSGSAAVDHQQAARFKKKSALHLSFPVNNTSANSTPNRRNNVNSDSSTAHYNYLRENLYEDSRELERQKRENERNNWGCKQRAKSVETIRLLERNSSSSSGSSLMAAPIVPYGITGGIGGGSKRSSKGSGCGPPGMSVLGSPCMDGTGGAANHHFNSSSTNLDILKINGQKYRVKKSDIEFQETLGAGVSGTVYRCLHKDTRVKMAVKVMTVTGNKDSDQQMFRDIQVNTLQHNCPHIVTSFGCIFTDQSIYICMEQMLTCLEKLLKAGACFEENVLGKIAYATLEALDYLKTKQSLIHRDIKPSNILVSHSGVFKLCDFGICGKLVNSNAATRSVGCVAYLAPERVEPDATYDIRADVWALGLTIMELALQKYPYSKFESCQSEFEVLVMIKDEEAPRLGSPFSKLLRDFTERCVQKNRDARPKHKELLKHSFVQKSQLSEFDVAQWVKKYVSLTPSGGKDVDTISVSSLTSEESLTPRKISSPGLTR